MLFLRDQAAPRAPMRRALAVAALIAAGCRGRAEGPDATAGPEPITESSTVVAGPLELFMEHPRLVVGAPAKFAVHLTVLDDGMPVRAGRLALSARGPSGRAVVAEQDAPGRPGIYGPTLTFAEPGPHELALELDGPQARGAIVATVEVYPDADAAARAPEPAEVPEDAVTFLKEQAWKVGLRHEPVATRRLVERLAAPGAIRPAAGARALVTAPAAGRLAPPPGSAFPRVGESVRAGQIVAMVEPPMAGPGGAAMLADRADVQAVAADLDARLARAEADVLRARADLDFATADHDRNRTLGTTSSVARQQIDESERRLRVARAEQQWAEQSRAIYEAARDDLRGMLASTGDGPEAPIRVARLPLAAPIGGVVVEARAVEGEYVDPSLALFEVVDLDRVWLEARVAEADLGRVVDAPAADFAMVAYPGRRFEALGPSGGRLVDVGAVVDPATRTLAVRYELPNPGRLLRVGMSAEVAIETRRVEEAIAVPESALVDDEGRTVAYVLVDGEHFQPRDLTLGLRDGGFVQVLGGLAAGERVATRGAYAIRLASASATIPAHGHAH